MKAITDQNTISYGQNKIRLAYPYVCLPCRTSFRRNVIWNAIPNELPCPHCGGPALWLSHKFRAPRRTDDAQWKKVEALVLAGARFCSTQAYAPYPEKLRDVPQFIETHYTAPQSTIGLPHEKPRYRSGRRPRRQCP